MIAVNASHCPRDIAWVEGEMEINWRELNRQIDQFAQALKDNGLQQGESVALLGGNSFWSYLTGFATMRAGCVICSMSTLLTPTMLLTLVDDCAVKLLFVDAAYLDLAQ
jgi:fatty-acyl-CoA synthase